MSDNNGSGGDHGEQQANNATAVITQETQATVAELKAAKQALEDQMKVLYGQLAIHEHDAFQREEDGLTADPTGGRVMDGLKEKIGKVEQEIATLTEEITKKEA